MSSDKTAYGRMLTIGLATAGVILGAGVGAFVELAHTLWPLAILVGIVVLNAATAARRDPDLAGLTSTSRCQ